MGADPATDSPWRESWSLARVPGSGPCVISGAAISLRPPIVAQASCRRVCVTPASSRAGGKKIGRPVPWLSKGIARAPARTPALLPSPLAPEGGVPARRLQSCLPASQTPPVGPQADATEPAEPSRRAIPSRRPSRLDGCRKSSMPTRATRGRSSTRRWECPCRRPRTRRFPTAPLWGRRSAPWRRSTETHYLCLCAPTTQRFRSRILRQQLQPSPL